VQDGPFIPTQGALADVSGFLYLETFDPIREFGDNQPFKISPMEDGVLWQGTNRFVNGESYPEFGIDSFTWTNDLVYKGFPALVDNLVQTPESPTSSDSITVIAEATSQDDST
ncbi:hypothetical protein RZS08_37840, partial [Arthrospira platensis SPKY1]|nr:hypothetical protein [Arthrospira platensis SPKY1]